MDLESNLLPEAPSIRARLWVREAQSTVHLRRGGCAVLLKAWPHASGKLDRFGLQELVGNPLTVPCGPFSSTSGLQRGLHGSHYRTALQSASTTARIVRCKELAMRARHALCVKALEQ